MANDKLGFGFIGAGEIAVASAKAVRGGKHAFIARVVDARADLAQDLAATYGGEPADSIEGLLGESEGRGRRLSPPPPGFFADTQPYTPVDLAAGHAPP